MAIKRTRVDDVLEAKGRTVPATESVTVVIPGAATQSGKPRRLALDVSPQGKKELDKMVADADRQTKQAWAAISALRPERAKKDEDTPKESKGGTEEAEATESEVEVEGTPAAEQEAPAAPSFPQPGSPYGA